MHAGRNSFGMSFGGENAKLTVTPRPISHSPKEAVGYFVLLHPHKGNRFICESPFLQDGESVQQTRERDPQKQGAILLGQFLYRQRTYISSFHRRIVTFRTASESFGRINLVLPGWVCIDDAVFFHLHHLCQWALNRLFERLPVLNSVKHSRTV